MTEEPRVPTSVTQADREAAADLMSNRHGWPAGTIQAMRDGKLDNAPQVQTFARHREASSTPALDERELKAALKLAVFHVKHMASWIGDKQLAGESGGYSFEGLGEDMPTIEAALASATVRHRFWRAGEPDCPADIKAPNGELHTLRCKLCSSDSPKGDYCRSALATRDRKGGS